MIHQIPGFIIITAVCVFIYLINAINLKKNRTIYCRATMLALIARHQQEPDSVPEEELSDAIGKYNQAAEDFNNTVSSGTGAVLNRILRYPLFETHSSQE